MPTPVDKVPVTWLEFLEATPPACRRTSTEKPERTHAPSASSLATCGATTTLTFDNDIRSTLLADHTRDWLATQKIEIIPEEDYTQPLHNEQGVAELYVHTVLSRVKQALDILLADLLKHKDLAKAKYCFNIRPQQGSPTRSNNTRCDHFLVLEHYDGIAEDTPPPKSIIWRDPKKIAEMLQARVEWESDISDMKGEAPAYPCLVLCVVEEKRPNVLRAKDFRPDYRTIAAHSWSDVAATGAKNVIDFLPAVKKYSVDAQCPMVVLTDYHTTILLNVIEPRAVFNEWTRQITPKAAAEAQVAVALHALPPRFALFAIAIKRLIDAKLLHFNVLSGNLDTGLNPFQ